MKRNRNTIGFGTLPTKLSHFRHMAIRNCNVEVTIPSWSVWRAGGAAERRGASAGCGGQVPAQLRQPRGRESQPLQHLVFNPLVLGRVSTILSKKDLINYHFHYSSSTCIFSPLLKDSPITCGLGGGGNLLNVLTAHCSWQTSYTIQNREYAYNPNYSPFFFIFLEWRLPQYFWYL